MYIVKYYFMNLKLLTIYKSGKKHLQTFGTVKRKGIIWHTPAAFLG